MISSDTRWAMFDGIEKPTPMEPDSSALPAVAMATLMPMSLPSLSTRAPPEFPGLIAASVWMTEIEIDWPAPCCSVPGRSNWNGLPCPPSSSGASSVAESGAADEAIWMLRFSALTMPVVTELDSPSGAPTATAVEPTLISDESANSIGFRPSASSSLITARS